MISRPAASAARSNPTSGGNGRLIATASPAARPVVCYGDIVAPLLDVALYGTGYGPATVTMRMEKS